MKEFLFHPAIVGRISRFLVEPANWPADADGVRVVPLEVVAFGHAVGVSALGGDASTGDDVDLSGAGARRERAA